MTQQSSFTSIEEAIDYTNKIIKEWEQVFKCSTEIMRQQYNRSRLDKTPEVIAWYTLAELRDYLKERMKCGSKL